MKNLIETRHTDLTIGELHRVVEENHQPIKRSPHIGNIQPKDLAVMTGLPPGVDVLMVNTIQGDDKITKPHVVQISEGVEIPLTSRNAARNRVVGAAAIKFVDETAHMLPVVPIIGHSLATFHMEALNRLPLHNRPMSMMERFSQHPDLLQATAEACKEHGCLHRKVEEGGKIAAADQPNLLEEGLFGIEDATPADRGALLPLNGMMVIDMLMSEAAGSNETIHLGGGDMVQYTRDKERMGDVGIIKARASAILGRLALPHRYIVQDCRGLAVMVPEVSQHELLLNGRTVDPTEHLDQPCRGSIDE